MSENATVGIVLVSHSSALAEGTAELAGQVGGGAVAIVPAGGTDDGGLGTSAAKVLTALRAADSGAGVLVLPDLGSSVLTVRALLAEWKLPASPDAGLSGSWPTGTGPDTLPEPVILADAPFVEGAVAAAVTAAAGGDIKSVLEAAEEARHARKL